MFTMTEADRKEFIELMTKHYGIAYTLGYISSNYVYALGDLGHDIGLERIRAYDADQIEEAVSSRY